MPGSTGYAFHFCIKVLDTHLLCLLLELKPGVEGSSSAFLMGGEVLHLGGCLLIAFVPVTQYPVVPGSLSWF